MSEKIQVNLEEVKRLFFFLEGVNDFFHQPEKYATVEKVLDFWQSGMFEELTTLYYQVVWDWLPPSVQQEIEDRPSPFSPTEQLGKKEEQ